MPLLDIFHSRPIWAEIIGLLLAFAIGAAWAYIIRRRKGKDKIDKAVDTLRGYCAKVNHCDNCRYRQDTDGSCPFMVETPPCDWSMDNRQQEQEAGA